MFVAVCAVMYDKSTRTWYKTIQIIEKHLPETPKHGDSNHVYLLFGPILSTNQDDSLPLGIVWKNLTSGWFPSCSRWTTPKTEFLNVRIQPQLERVNTPFINVNAHGVSSKPRCNFTTNQIDMRMIKACQDAYYHLHDIRKIKKSWARKQLCARFCIHWS